MIGKIDKWKFQTMASVKTFGIVLKGTNFGEADKILTILTERLGKVKAIAKGVRKMKSHLAGSLEPFMLVDLQLHEGRTFHIVTGARIKNDFPEIHTDLGKIAKAFFLGELVDKFVAENHPVPDIFELLKQALAFLEYNNRDLTIRAFELKIIEAAGFNPELFECVHCKENISAGENFWDDVEGGVICGGCQAKIHHGKEIDDETIKLFRFIVQNEYKKINLLKLNPKTEMEAENILSEYIRNILEKDLKSQRFLKMI